MGRVNPLKSTVSRQIGRAAWRERVEMSVGEGALKIQRWKVGTTRGRRSDADEKIYR